MYYGVPRAQLQAGVPMSKATFFFLGRYLTWLVLVALNTAPHTHDQGFRVLISQARGGAQGVLSYSVFAYLPPSRLHANPRTSRRRAEQANFAFLDQCRQGGSGTKGHAEVIPSEAAIGQPANLTLEAPLGENLYRQRTSKNLHAGSFYPDSPRRDLL